MIVRRNDLFTVKEELSMHEFDDAVIRIKNKLAEYKNRREKRNEIL